MSSTAKPLPPADPPPELAALRAELDRLDDGLHDLLMRRAEVVARIGRLGAKGRVALRAGREAAIIRRLLARHQGPLPPQALPRLWRELLAATTAMQGGFRIAVCDGGDGEMTALAREHFGALTPVHVHRTPAQAVRDVSAGIASAAVLPPPAEGDGPAAWWVALLNTDEPRIHVVARLPFWSLRPEGAPRLHALVVSAAPPDPSGEDRSLIGLEFGGEISRARLTALFTAAGLTPRSALLHRTHGAEATQALVGVDGFVTEDDPCLARLGKLPRPPVVLGAYAVPVGEDRP